MPTQETAKPTAKKSQPNPFFFEELGDELMWKKVRVIGFLYQPQNSFPGEDGKPVNYGSVRVLAIVPQPQPREGFVSGLRGAEYKISTINNEFFKHDAGTIALLQDSEIFPAVFEVGFIEQQKKKDSKTNDTVTEQKAVDFRILQTNNGWMPPKNPAN
jgi:hypothetical protein